MNEEKIKESLKECEEYKDSIMESVCKLIKSKKYKYSMNNSNTEIIIPQPEDKIKKIINKLDIPKEIVKMLISISQTNGNTYIRLKFS